MFPQAVASRHQSISTRAHYVGAASKPYVQACCPIWCRQKCHIHNTSHAASSLTNQCLKAFIPKNYSTHIAESSSNCTQSKQYKKYKKNQQKKNSIITTRFNSIGFSPLLHMNISSGALPAMGLSLSRLLKDLPRANACIARKG